MKLDFGKLIAKTDLENKVCVEKMLNRLGVETYNSLQNVPGRYGKPFICSNPTGVVVAKLNEAMKVAAKEIPSIEDFAPAAIKEPGKPPVVQETLLAEVELPGVHDSARQKLHDAGIVTVGDVLKDQGKHLTEVPGIGDATKERIVSAVKAALEFKE